MSWDTRGLFLLALVWALLSVIYVSVIGMMSGARAWGAGAVIFAALALGLWYADRLGARRRPTGEKA